MNKPLKKGDVFFLPEGTLVDIEMPWDPNHHNHIAEVGHHYEMKAICAEDRFKLRTGIQSVFSKNKIRADANLISRFVNYVAKDRPSSMFCIPAGLFWVTRVRSEGDNNEETVHCRRYYPEPGQRTDQVSFLQNKHGAGHYPHNVVRSFKPQTCYPCTTNNPAWKWKAVSSPMSRT